MKAQPPELERGREMKRFAAVLSMGLLLIGSLLFAAEREARTVSLVVEGVV